MFEFKFSLNEANAILAALGKQPFEQVADLIKNVHMQAQPQMERVKAEMEAEAKAAAEAQAAEGQAAETAVA